MPDRPVVIVSNRGPVSFRAGDGDLEARRGAGGLVTGLGSLADSGATWIAAALTGGDREAAERGALDAAGFRVRLLAFDRETYAKSYDVVSNATLWFVHHHLFDLARRPRFDARWQDAWEAYRVVNARFAEAVAMARGDLQAGVVERNLGIAGQARQRPAQHLDGGALADDRMRRAEDRGHAAFRDLLVDAELADDAARGRIDDLGREGGQWS